MVSQAMEPSLQTDLPVGQPEARFDPYVRLLRSLLPRASCVALFGAGGELMWSTEQTLGPDLLNAVDDALLGARAGTSGTGQLRTLEGNTPVYLCPLRADAGQLLALSAVMCKPHDTREKRNLDFVFAYSLIAPALECLRRELITRVTIEELNATVSALDKDLNLLLLTRGALESSAATPDGVNDLQLLVQQTIEHLHACAGALLVPEKNVTLARSAGGSPPDTQFLMRAHKRLLAIAQQNPQPFICNDVLSAATPDAFPYRVLCCSLRSRAGRSMGVLALLREATAEPFSERDAQVTEILARKATSVIESNYDSLSGLYTRAAFERRVRAVVTDKKVARQWSALYVDVDQLHLINEKSGMHVGDAVLAELGELLRQRLPPGAFGARISGDRFAVLLPAAAKDAEKFADALRTGAELTGAAQGETRLPVSISIGVAPLDGSGEELAHVLAAAETACKAAKDRGRNRVEVYSQSDVSIARRYADIGIAGQLREAIDAGRLHLDAQLILPFAGTDTARPHFELLLRMTNEAGKTMGPDSFLSAATRYQLMPVIDRWVVNHVLEALRPRASVLEGKALGFSINFSGQSLNDDAFSDMLIERLDTSGLDPELFCFELTENATVAALPRARALMQCLRRLGCGVALDDFGTGLSSLSCLRELPVTMLKIDGSFVRDVLRDARAESMVRAIAQLARSMSIITVAEYVETPEIGARVASLGVDYGQGFAIGRPIPFVDLLAELPLPEPKDSAPFADDRTTQVAQVIRAADTHTDEVILTAEPRPAEQSDPTIEEPAPVAWFAGRTH